MASVVTLCMGGAGNNGRQLLSPDHLRGDLFRGNFVRRDVPYTTIPSLANAEEGAANLDNALHSYPGLKMVVETQSMGSQVAYKWLRDYGPTSDIDPDDVIFAGTGNLERKYGGAATVPESGISADYGGIGIPDDTPYTVYDVARQYEFWCDYPTGEMNELAGLNALAGFFLHLDYSQVTVNDPRNIEYVEGNRHYILAPTWPLPMIGKMFRSAASINDADQEHRSTVEAAFDRPFEVPVPTVRRITSWLGWDTTTNRFVSTYVPKWKPFG